jgi:hypothetical protein
MPSIYLVTESVADMIVHTVLISIIYLYSYLYIHTNTYIYIDIDIDIYSFFYVFLFWIIDTFMGYGGYGY